jgi:hypothetical protein
MFDETGWYSYTIYNLGPLNDARRVHFSAQVTVNCIEKVQAGSRCGCQRVWREIIYELINYRL